MPYTKTTYSTTVTAANLNKGEQQIEDVTVIAEAAEADVTGVITQLPINPKDSPYNAVFDGTTDDTAAINSAIVAANAAGRDVLLPKGTAVINPAVKLTMLNNVHLRGQGIGVTTLLMKPNSATTGGVWSILNVDEKTRWSVRDITFDGNRRNGNHGASEDIDGIHAAHSGYFEIAHCEFKNFRSEGVYLSQQNPYSTGTVSVTNGSATVTAAGGADWNNGGLGDPAAGQIFNVGSPLGRNYTVQSVDSATQITLTENYEGATASGQSYAIAPARPYHFSVHHNVFTDCGIGVAGDANTTARMGIAVIAAEDFDISHNVFDGIGSVAVDLEPNLSTQILRNGVVSENRMYDCASFFVNVAPAAAGPASSATGLRITGNVGRGAVAKGFIARATNTVISGNVALQCEQVGIQAHSEAGGASSGLVITDNVLDVIGPSPLAGVYMEASTGCVVTGNVLLSTLGTAAVIENGAANSNVLGPNRIAHTADYVRTGAATQIISNKLLRFGGSEGQIDAAGGVLYLRSGAANDQIVFLKSAGGEDARFDASGHFVMNGVRRVKAGGVELATAVAAASAANNSVFLDSADSILKRKDNSGNVAVLASSGTGQPEPVNTVATSGSAQTIPDPATTPNSHITLTANCTLTFPTAAAGKSFTLALKQDGTGSRTVTWPAAAKWPSATAPTLSTGAGKVDMFTFVCLDGTIWMSMTAGIDFR